MLCTEVLYALTDRGPAARIAHSRLCRIFLHYVHSWTLGMRRVVPATRCHENKGCHTYAGLRNETSLQLRSTPVAGREARILRNAVYVGRVHVATGWRKTQIHIPQFMCAMRGGWEGPRPVAERLTIRCFGGLPPSRGAPPFGETREVSNINPSPYLLGSYTL